MFEILSDLNVIHLLGMAAAIFVAAVLRAFTGFGFALAALPVLSLFLAPSTSVSIVVLLTLGVSLQTFRSYARDVEVKPMITMVGLSAIATVAGTFLLLLIEPDTFKIIIGLIVMIACFLLTRFKPAQAEQGGLKACIAGFASGLMNGAVGIPGPPVIIYAMAVFSEAKYSRAFLMMFFLFSAVFATISYVFSGIITSKVLVLFVAAYPAMMMGDRIGFWLFKHYGSAAYRNIAIGALFIVGASITLTAVL